MEVRNLNYEPPKMAQAKTSESEIVVSRTIWS